MVDSTMLPAPNATHDDQAWTGRVFLVQLRGDAATAAGRFSGRVQHMRSSDAAHFESLDELAAFMLLCTHGTEDSRSSGPGR